MVSGLPSLVCIGLVGPLQLQGNGNVIAVFFGTNVHTMRFVAMLVIGALSGKDPTLQPTTLRVTSKRIRPIRDPPFAEGTSLVLSSLMEALRPLQPQAL